jgi:3-dehydroquinate dehydratase-2
MQIIIINGPNLNLLGQREKNIYGDQSFNEYFERLRKDFAGHHLEYYQSNHEGSIVDKIQEVGFSYDGIVINAGAYTHTSVAIRDAIASVTTPVIEVHISNIYSREQFRHHSYLSPVCKGMIAGLGLEGYRLAVDYFAQQ